MDKTHSVRPSNGERRKLRPGGCSKFLSCGLGSSGCFRAYQEPSPRLPGQQNRSISVHHPLFGGVSEHFLLPATRCFRKAFLSLVWTSIPITVRKYANRHQQAYRQSSGKTAVQRVDWYVLAKLLLEPTRHDSALVKQNWCFVKLLDICQAEREINQLARTAPKRDFLARFLS
uniref:Uncharacterized protein n=1 Tax=Candidatus Kentrum sp. LFY TaxID=2126342 RepID=A0A450UMS0_9GAMM|nr:MAG: hypothetical protein BECKLFY1418A_GA0070994_103424 [Candidatus Kentron sp. LFY]